MTNSRASGRLQTIHEETLATDQLQMTHTFDPPIILDNWQCLIISLTGKTDGAGGVELELDGLESAYNYNYSEDDNGTVTYVEATAQTQQILCDVGLLSASLHFAVHMTITPYHDNTNPYSVTQGVVDVKNEGRSFFSGWQLNSTPLNSIILQLSAQKMLASTRLRISGIKKHGT